MEDIDTTIDPQDPRVGYVYHVLHGDRHILGFHRQVGERWRDHFHDYRADPPLLLPQTVWLTDVLARVVAMATRA